MVVEVAREVGHKGQVNHQKDNNSNNLKKKNLIKRHCETETAAK